MSSMSVDGVRMNYHTAGSGPVLVAHPGGPGFDYAYLRSPELEKHFTVVYPEPVGTGASDRPAAYGLDTYVRFLAALIDHLGEERVHLLGHSHGGFVAQRYALEHPDRLAGLILYHTSPVADPEWWAAAMAGLNAYPGLYPDRPEAAGVPAAFQNALGAADDEQVSARLREALPVYFADFWARREEFADFLADVRICAEAATAPDAEPFDVRDRLGEITAPTVVISGRRDFICGPRWSVMLRDGIPGARLTVLEHSGHFGHVEQPAQFVRAITDLLPD
ncbi:alpha/beta hydrolase [Streptomyces sp. NPDC005423]|uniref:alpha/beta fold hydrolase n=1 Tax=Streptomyces sp. NPDC005423 TaxID=3155343 RepID=UPI00339F8D0D